MTVLYPDTRRRLALTTQEITDETTQDYELHPLSTLFPDMPEEKFKVLTDSIELIGQLEPITITGSGLLLDGRHRLRACQELGIQAKTRVFGGDPLDYVIAKNSDRRDLKTEQRALIAAELSSDSTVGRPSKLSKDRQLTQGEAAERLGVSRQFVNQASQILESGEADLIAGLRSGKMRVKEAADRLDERRRARGEIVDEDEEVETPTEPQPEERNTDEDLDGPELWDDDDFDRPDDDDGEFTDAQVGAGLSRLLGRIRSGKVRVTRRFVNQLREQFDEIITELENKAIE